MGGYSDGQQSDNLVRMTPTILPYVPLLELKDVKPILGRLCYFIEPYKLEGVAVVIYLSKGLFHVKASKWSGMTVSADLDVTKIKKGTLEADILARWIPHIIKIMKYAKIIQAEYYFSGMMLVDVRLSVDKFIGPGMLRDLFAKTISTQKILKVAAATEEEMKGITAILKPSVYKTIVAGDDMVPLYCKI